MTRTPCSRAAWMLSEPHPHPTSSRRIPGSSRSLLHTRSSLSRCASASDASGTVRCPVRARVRHVLVEEQLVEVVRQVVVMRDHGPVATPGVAPTADLRLRRGRRGGSPTTPSRTAVPSAPNRSRVPARWARLPRVRASSHTRPEAVVEVTVDVEVAGDVGPREPELVGAPQEPAQRAPRPCSTTTGAPAGPTSLPSQARRRTGSSSADEGVSGGGELLGTGRAASQPSPRESTIRATSR